jgi:hypothetical protein
LGIALWLLLRYRRQQRDSKSKLQELQADEPIAKGQSVTVSDPKELPAQHGVELYTAEHRAELPHNQNRAVELDAGVGYTAQKNEKSGLV